MTRRAWLLLALGLFLIALTLVLARADAVQGDWVHRTGAVPVEIPNAPRWWRQTAACLGDPAPYPARVRFYVGRTIPSDWLGSGDAGRALDGYTAPDGSAILLDPLRVGDSSVVAHELWHAVHGDGHPARIFAPPRCGLARP